MLLWGEGASVGVANLIHAVDGDYLALRAALDLPTELRYHDFLIRQGVAAKKAETLYETIHASDLAKARFQCGPEALEHRYIAEDVPYSLVLASSIAAELDVRSTDNRWSDCDSVGGRRKGLPSQRAHLGRLGIGGCCKRRPATRSRRWVVVAPPDCPDADGPDRNGRGPELDL